MSEKEEFLHDSESPGQGCKNLLGVTKNGFEYPQTISLNSIMYKIMDYNIFHESRGKTLKSCIINNVECIAKRVKQSEGIKSILSLYLPCESKEFCFTLKGICLGNMFKNCQVDHINIFQFVKDMLCTLILLEKSNITHNDIKPYNIILYEDHWFLIDYELAKPFKLKCGKYFDCNNGKLRCERFSRGYRAPERIKSKIISPKTDLYSLGLVILELIHGRRLSGMENPTQVQHYLQQAQEGMLSEIDLNHCKYILYEILPQILQQKSSNRPTPISLLNHLKTLNTSQIIYSDFSYTLSFFSNTEYFNKKFFSIHLPDS